MFDMGSFKWLSFSKTNVNHSHDNKMIYMKLIIRACMFQNNVVTLCMNLICNLRIIRLHMQNNFNPRLPLCIQMRIAGGLI